MNVIVSNRQKEIIDNANIDAIKDLNGLFNVSDLINKFKNYFFSKMILDATSVVDFASREVLTTLANEIGAEKLIILLPSTPEPPMEFKKLLIELKIYNFTNNIEDVIKFIEKPNTYEDAIKLLDNGYSSDIYVDNSIKEGEDVSSNEEISPPSTEEDDYKEDIMANTIMHSDDASATTNVENNDVGMNNNYGGKSSLGDILNNLNLENTSREPVNNNSTFTENIFDHIETKEEVSNDNLNSSIVNNEPKTETKNTFLISDDFNNVSSVSSKPKKRVYGFKNITLDAGSTSLIYMLHKILLNMNKNVLSIEIGKNDFRLFRDNKMVSADENNILEIINNSDADVIFIDLNDYNNYEICDDVIYLVEPSVIKLNGLMATNKNIFNELKGKKVILNKSLLSSSDIHTLESEAGLEFLCNIEPLNDRVFNESISKLVNLLGIN